jgi:hypothetical protein
MRGGKISLLLRLAVPPRRRTRDAASSPTMCAPPIIRTTPRNWTEEPTQDLTLHSPDMVAMT